MSVGPPVNATHRRTFLLLVERVAGQLVQICIFERVDEGRFGLNWVVCDVPKR